MAQAQQDWDTPDVVVIGGAPAGSPVSTLLAQQGVSVELFERERFPRFHIGESLIPETYWVLKRLNMLPKMQQSHFVKKYSVQFVNASGKLSAPFYFWDNKPHECSQTWQVVRSEFDQMMLCNAREHGVRAPEGGGGPPGARPGCCRIVCDCASGTPCLTKAPSGPTGKAPVAIQDETKARRWCCQRRTRTAGPGRPLF